MSSKIRSHDVVCGFREAKTESSGPEGVYLKSGTRVFFKEWDKMEGIRADLSTRLVSGLEKIRQANMLVKGHNNGLHLK
jgi:hypothetical protein